MQKVQSAEEDGDYKHRENGPSIDADKDGHKDTVTVSSDLRETDPEQHQNSEAQDVPENKADMEKKIPEEMLLLPETERKSKGQASGSRKKQYLAALLVNLSTLANGLSFGWPAIALPQLQDATPPINIPPLNDDQASWLASTLLLSSAFTVPVWVFLNARCGSKICGYLVGLTLGLHWVILATTENLPAMFVARVMAGIGSTGILVFCPPYVREMSENEIRGTLGVFISWTFNLGMVIVYAVGGSVSYQTFNFISLAFVVAFLVCFWKLPESPVFLVRQGNDEGALNSLRWFRGNVLVEDELQVLHKEEERRLRDESGSLKDILYDKASIKGIIITVVLCANQPFCGLFAVLNYTVAIFIEAGTSVHPNTAATIVGVLLLLGSVVSSQLVDRLGRRILLFVSNLGMAVCLSSLGLYFYLKHINVDVGNLGWLPLASLSTFMVSVSLAVTCLPFVVMMEIFLPRVQNLAVALGLSVICFFGFIATKFFIVLADFLGIYSCYWIFSIFCVAITIYLYFALPETKGKSLDIIRDELNGIRVCTTSRNFSPNNV